MIIEPGSAEWYFERFPGFYNNACYEILEQWGRGVPEENKEEVLQRFTRSLSAPSTESQNSDAPVPDDKKDTGPAPEKPLPPPQESRFKNKKRPRSDKSPKWPLSALQEGATRRTNLSSTANTETRGRGTTRGIR